MILKRLTGCLLFAVLFIISAPASASFFNDAEPQPGELNDVAIRSEIMDEFEQWKGVRYQLGGTSINGIDCSSLIQEIYHSAFTDKQRERLLRTTGQQIKQGVMASRYDLRPGDLVFFQLSAGRHVGIYIGDNQFIHASTSRGVIISTLENDYWSKNFKVARRILT